MASAWGKSFGAAFGNAWGTVGTAVQPGAPGLAGYAIRIPKPRARKRTRSQNQIIVISTPPLL